MRHLDRGAMSRREFLASASALGAATALPVGAMAQSGAGEERHGLSIFGDLKYGSDFRHFDYVRPDAPKGGEIALQIVSAGGNQKFLTYNTLNMFSNRGDGAAGMSLTFDSLMTGSLDEPDSLYGLVARSVAASADGLVYRFRLRPEARFHDGSALRAEDVAFSIDTLRGEKAHIGYRVGLAPIESVAALAPDLVEVRFRPGRSREMPLAVAGLPIFSKAYYAGRDFDASTLDAPLGSGPYRVDKVDVGRSIAFRRVEDYWAKDLPVSRGQGNFDRIRFEYFRDREAAFQAFTAGQYDIREELTSVIWATRYDFPAFKEGRVKRTMAADGRPSGTQGWFINTRRAKFRDPRVREAIALAFDFEWVNTNLMYSTYKRTISYFENSPLKAEGAPDAAERALLEPFRGSVPDEVFGSPWAPPVTDGSGQDRNVLRRASQLLAAAGTKRGPDGTLVLADGTPLTIEFLEDDNSLSKHTEAFIKNLRLLGIRAEIRQVDATQFSQREREFDFDLLMRRFTMSLAPGESLRLFFGSRQASQPGSRNLAGIADPAVDAMIEQAIAAGTREEVTSAVRALDRLLRAGRYWVPAWYSGAHRYAYWDRFGQPGDLPAFGGSVGATAAAIWWHDADKAKAIGR